MGPRAERCRSGRSGRSRKPLGAYASRGFESLPLRQMLHGQYPLRVCRTSAKLLKYGSVRWTGCCRLPPALMAGRAGIDGRVVGRAHWCARLQTAKRGMPRPAPRGRDTRGGTGPPDENEGYLAPRPAKLPSRPGRRWRRTWDLWPFGRLGQRPRAPRPFRSGLSPSATSYCTSAGRRPLDFVTALCVHHGSHGI